MGHPMTVKERITQIGGRLVKCPRSCRGVVLKPKEGIIPRSLAYEARGVEGDRGVVVVGINPGRMRERERSFYRDHPGDYFAVAQYEAGILRRHRYHKRIRALLGELNWTGPILWTSLVKCDRQGKGDPPLQTQRTCMGHFLGKELDPLPDWPILAVGKTPFHALSYRYPDRYVIGIPHATGSYGQFLKLFQDGHLRKGFQINLDGLHTNTPGIAVWMDAERGILV